VNGSRTGVEHLDCGGRPGVPLLDLEQHAQRRILVAQPRELLRRQRMRDEVRTERGVFLGQRALRREVVGEPRQRFAGQLHGALQRVQHHRGHLPDAFEIAEARVREHERDRQQAEEREPRQRRWAAVEKRWRLGTDVAHDGGGKASVRGCVCGAAAHDARRRRKRASWPTLLLPRKRKSGRTSLSSLQNLTRW
jgi:hypothetical protein